MDIPNIGFVLLKNTEKQKPNHPDYRISTKIGDEWVEAGACWIKEGKTGKYLSCKMAPKQRTVAQISDKEIANPDSISF